LGSVDGAALGADGAAVSAIRDPGLKVIEASIAPRNWNTASGCGSPNSAASRVCSSTPPDPASRNTSTKWL
jgi:hypothetical protein